MRLTDEKMYLFDVNIDGVSVPVVTTSHAKALAAALRCQPISMSDGSVTIKVVPGLLLPETWATPCA